MKKLLTSFLFCSVSILFMGCPYSSEVAIDAKPNVKADAALIGSWEQRNSADYTYKVTKDDDYIMSIDKITKSSNDVTSYKAFISVVNNERFLNVWEKDASTPSYYFYKIAKGETESLLTLMSVTENIDEKFTSSDALKSFISKNSNLSFFFEKEEDSYIKTGK